jgi:murein DD-endopeptidase MepM/ murein hydrolase activator NlpD
MSSSGSVTSTIATSFFLIFFSLVFLFFPNTASAVTTEEHFGYQVYAANNPWRNPSATAGGVDGRYGTCDVDNPSPGTVFSGGSNCTIVWDFRGFPEIPVGSTINKLVVKTYANTSGNSGQFRIGFEGGECDISDFNWQNNITSYLIPNGKCGYNLYTHADIRRDFSISNHYVPGKPNHINLDAISIFVDYTPPQPPTPTQTPTPTPTPTPAGPEPFLDLPWDYEGKGLNFSEAALAINSFFDHEYPLQSRGLDLKEPTASISSTTVTFLGYPRKDIDHNGIWYSSHDGYDYGNAARVNNGDPVYPAAPGIAEYKYDLAGGYTIFIDHKNGYQTRYYHLQDTGLITNQPGVKVEVNRNTIIGKVGSTGKHTTGAHIHIGLFQDKNYDKDSNNNFVNYEPHGATDPFGWQPYMEESERDPDPWENYSFSYNGKQRTGSKSYYLWTKKLPGVKETVTSAGGTYAAGDVSVKVEPDTFANPVTLDINYATSFKASDSTWSTGPTVNITAKNLLGDFVTLLTKPVELRWAPFKNIDLSRFKFGTFYLYSSKNGIEWTRETEVNPFIPGDITVEASHLTYFAIMGERKDMIPPATSAELQGERGDGNWFRGDVNLALNATDSADEDQAGVDYILYKIEGEDWKTYTGSLGFTEEGNYKVSFYSVDKDGNIEDVKTIEFDIDKTPPTVEIKVTPSLMWPPNGKLVDVRITGNSADKNLKGITFRVIDEYGRVEPEIKSFSQTIKLEAKRDGNDKDGRAYTIQVKTEDLAGNMAEATTMVVVPHNQSE